MQTLLESPAMRGRTRPVASYHAQRGWFYPGVLKVVRKWVTELDRSIILRTFDDMRRVMEEASGEMHVTVHGTRHRRFLCELMSALDDLHDPENEAGWVIRLFGVSKSPPLLSHCEITHLRSLRDRLLKASTPVYGHLKLLLSEVGVDSLKSSLRARLSNAELVQRILGGLVTDLNRVICGDCIFEERYLAEVRLRPQTRLILERMRRPEFVLHLLNQTGQTETFRHWLNRMLLEDMFPKEIAKMELGTKVFRYPDPRPFTYPELAIEILARGGPSFTPGSLEKTAKRLRLTGESAAKESSFYQESPFEQARRPR